MSAPRSPVEPVLLVFGDTNVQRRDRPGEAFDGVRDLFASADAVVCHAEGLFSAPPLVSDQPDIPHKPFWTHSTEADARAFVEAGVTAVSCASNVSYPRPAVVRSLDCMQRVGLSGCGIGLNLDQARHPALFSCGPLRCGLLSRTSVFWPLGHAAEPDQPGAATVRASTAYEPHRRVHEMPGAPAVVRTWPDDQELKQLEDDIQALRPSVDIVLLSMHWGVSSSKEILDYQRAIARAAVRAGADLVFGHHPHVVQDHEWFDGTPVFYSLGNFAFDWPKFRDRALDGLGLRCRLKPRSVTIEQIIAVRRDPSNIVRPLDPASSPGACNASAKDP